MGYDAGEMWLEKEESATCGRSHGLGATSGPEFGEHGADVEFSGMFADAELGGDGFVGEATRK